MDDLLRLEPDGRHGEIAAADVRDSAEDELILRHVAPAPEAGLAVPLERRRLQAYLTILVGDVLAMLGSFFAISAAYFGTFTDYPLLAGGMVACYLILPLYLTIALYNRAYSRRSLTDWRYSSKKALIALLVSAGLLNLLAFFAKSNAEFSRFVFTTGVLGSAVLFAMLRLIAARVIARRWGQSAVNRLVIHAGGPRVSLPDAVEIDAWTECLVPDRSNPQALDRLAKYMANMDEVIVSCTPSDRHAWAEVLKGSGLHGEVVDELSHSIGALGVMHHREAGMTTLVVSAGQLGIRARFAKRAFDLSIAIPTLVVLTPLLILVALLIKLEDGGPVLFRQRRMGWGNRFFDIYKFRSMRVADSEGTRSTTPEDERVTRIGRLVRRSSVDELPQLWNVIRGDMSLVGPRPHALGSKAGEKPFWQVDRKYWQRHGLRPGMTGLAQVRGYRGATDTELQLTDRLAADLEYINGWNLLRDIAILVATLRVLVHPRAY